MSVQGVLKPGDVLAVRGGGLPGKIIRIGEELSGKPGLDAHVAMFHHYDSGGVPWVLEGRPGGVGWADARPYLASPYTVNNCGQPGRTDLQRSQVADKARALLGTAYDWQAIGGDALAALHVRLWNLKFPHGLAPGEVVCSSFAAWLYGQAGWDHPSTGDERNCEPADWCAFDLDHGYSIKLAT
jgi:hypothetical protein